MPCFSPLKGFKDLETGGWRSKGDNAGPPMEVACSQCLGCRLDRARTWAMRIMHHAHGFDVNSFITLTYAPEFEPPDGSLNVAHYQKFMKRLRKKFPDRKITYYHCGEYGDKLYRPHYHACLFNVGFPDQELLKERNGNSLFTSKILQKLWPYGFVTVGELTFQSAAYVSRYCLKKVNGVQAHDHYLRTDENGVAYWLAPEYVTMSNGIGMDFYEKYKGDFFPSDETPIPGQGVVKGVPRFYTEALREADPGLFEEVTEARRCYRQANAAEFTPERLMSKYKIARAQSQLLPRTLES